ncbi:hypothetical protein AYI69_g27 [Smittium culicis]|uniref:Uncharacterized protein n=1 Tax=Smittium culicis TaxID=133412 RepID=A0A1R1YU55_9FUNG|nr:hypothetical protein AYI69_g27 [Smittium culicis]
MVNIRSKNSSLNTMFGPHEMELFASSKNKKLKAYYSCFPDARVVDIKSVDQMGWMKDPIRLPATELNLESASECQTGATDSKSGYISMEISNIFPRPDEIINIPTASASGDSNNSRPLNRKIAVNREQTLESDGLADQRRDLQEKGLSDLAIDIFVSN